MGTYATTTSFSDLLIDTSVDTATSALLSKLITRSEAKINAQISKRYDVSSFNTATAVPPQLTELCEQLTEAFFYISNSRGNKDAIARGKLLKECAMEDLDDIAKSKVNLVDTAGSSITERASGQWDMTSSTIDYNSTFNEDSAENWKIDPDKLSDISDSRSS